MACSLRGGQQWSCWDLMIGLINNHLDCRHIENLAHKHLLTASQVETFPERELDCIQKHAENEPEISIGCRISWLDQWNHLGLAADHPATYASFLRKCSITKTLSEGKLIHACIIKSGWERNVFLGNLLVQMYGNCGGLEDASAVFGGMHRHNLFSWNFMLRALVQHGQATQALELFQQMPFERVMPNKITFVITLSACDNQVAVSEGKQIHALLIDSGWFWSDVFVGTALVTMYGRCGSVEDAQRVFDEIPARNVVSWNAIISAYSHLGHSTMALCLFQQMLQEGMIPSKVTFVSLLDACASQVALAEGKQRHAELWNSGFESDVVVGNALVNLYGKCGNLEEAQMVYDNIAYPNLESRNAMIAVYANNCLGTNAIQLFQQMQLEGLMPNSITFISMLSVCATLGVLTEGKRLHTYMLSSGFESDVVLGTALVNMYGKCGNLVDAQEEFDEMLDQNTMTWNAMIAAYAQHGYAKQALSIFQQMQPKGMIPDEVTFVSILSACTHTGLVDEGCHYFISMNQDHGITPNLEHFHCMFDLLGRAGRLKGMEVLIKAMPFQPTATSWTTLLGACRMHLDIQQGEHAAKNVCEFEPENAAPFLLLSTIYAGVGTSNIAR